MKAHELETRPQAAPGLLRQVEEEKEEKPEAQGLISRQYDSLAQLNARTGSEPGTDARTVAARRSVAGGASGLADTMLRLQRTYGNRYTQGLIARAADSSEAPEVAPEVEESIQRARGGGQALDSRAREQMEPAFGVDFGHVRVHTGTEADGLNRAVNARAFTTGQDIFFREGEYSPTSSNGRELLAHELTHVVQQTGWVQTKLAISEPGDKYEQEADSVALNVMQQEHGNTQVRRIQTSDARWSSSGRPVVQRHSSWEHRLLGDASPNDLANVASRNNPQDRIHVLQEERQRLQIWQKDPESVTQSQVEASWPEIRVVTLRNGLIVTYGELNTLGDYLANPQAIDTASRKVILPILQLVRQQGFNRITDLLGLRRTVTTPDGLPMSVPAYEHFGGAIGPLGARGKAADILEAQAIQGVTASLGTNQYLSLLARNACHFAPYSWHRWQEHHIQARDLATRAHAANDQELVRQAWLTNGYADHFLQDSFAAGHLINKTLIMQWFVEWIEQYNSRTKWWSPNFHLESWDKVRTMSTTLQPGVAGRPLYSTSTRTPAKSSDPQTAEEQGTLAERMNASGVQAAGDLSQAQAYQNYLAFLNSTVVQSAAGAVHAYFNERALWVGSPAYPKAYQIWGDETMLAGGEGVGIAGETAHMSQQAIDDLVRTGQTSFKVQQIRDRFPDRVQVQGSSQLLSLEDWNNSLRKTCFSTIFPDLWIRIVDTISSKMGKVSQDQGKAVAGASTPPGLTSHRGSPDAGTPGPSDAGETANAR